jgi:hypothetical protein
MKTPFPGMDLYLDTRSRFDLRLAYAQPPVPPLAPADADWAATLDHPSPL